MVITLNTGKKVSLPDRFEDLKFRSLLDWDVAHGKITQIIKDSADDFDEVSVSSEIFIKMVECLADVTDSKVEHWLEEISGDPIKALNDIQRREPSIFEAQERLVTTMFARVAVIASEYTEPRSSELTPLETYEFEYFAFSDNPADQGRVITWELPAFVKDIYGGKRPANLLTWQVVEAKEANRLFVAALDSYRESFGDKEPFDQIASATLTRSLIQIAALCRPKGEQIYCPKTQEDVKDYIQKKMMHFRDIPARSALDIAFFLKSGVDKYLTSRITDFTLSLQTPLQEGEA